MITLSMAQCGGLSEKNGESSNGLMCNNTDDGDTAKIKVTDDWLLSKCFYFFDTFSKPFIRFKRERGKSDG